MAVLKRCSLCKRHRSGKPATAYWRWFPNASEGVGYRLYYCNDCWRQLATTIRLQLALEWDEDAQAECAVCGSQMTGGVEAAYLYLYPPRQGSQELIVPTCGPCLDLVVEDVRKYGTRLDDRNQDSRTAEEFIWSIPDRAA